MPTLRHELTTLLGPFVRYCTVGVGNTLLDFGIYTGLTRGWSLWRTHFLLANATAFTLVVLWSFYWNKRWAFHNHTRTRGTQLVKFIAVTLGGVAIAEGVLFVGVRTFGAPDLLAKVFAGPLVVFWNFFMYRYWAFAERRPEPFPEFV